MAASDLTHDRTNPIDRLGDPEAGAEPRDQTEKPRRGDKAPGKRGKRSKPPPNPGRVQGAALKARSKVLESKLTELLTFPAVPAAMVARDDLSRAYMIEHFSRSGPSTAKALVDASESNEQLRALLERITTGGSMLAIAIALVTYAAPPVIWTLGMREQAARITQMTTMTPEEFAAMLQSAQDAATAQAAAAQDNGAPSPEAAPGPGAVEPEPETGWAGGPPPG